MFCSYFQVEKLVAAKVERAKNYRTLVNFSRKEMKVVNSQALPLNSTLWRLHKPTCWVFTKLGKTWLVFLLKTLLLREGNPTNYQAIRACCRFVKLECQQHCCQNFNWHNFSSRKEGVTVGGLSLAASYMAQVKIVQWSIFSLFRQHWWPNTPPPPPSHQCSATSQSMCASTFTLLLGISTAGFTSLRLSRQTSAALNIKSLQSFHTMR